MLSNILVLASKTLDFTPKDGDAIKGTQVHYVMSDMPGDGETKGFLPVKAFLKGRAADNVRDVPGIYQGSFRVATKEGKIQLELVDLDLVSPVTLTTTAEPKAKG